MPQRKSKRKSRRKSRKKNFKMLGSMYSKSRAKITVARMKKIKQARKALQKARKEFIKRKKAVEKLLKDAGYKNWRQN